MALRGNDLPGPRTGLTPEAEENRRASVFRAGNAGRPKGTRRKLTESFLKALYEDFNEHGAAAIQSVRKNDPSTYLRVVARMVPLNITANEDEKVVTEIVYRWASDDSEDRDAALLAAPVAGSTH